MIKWGIIGWGNIARKFAAALALSNTGTLHAIGSRSGTSASDLLEESVKLYRTYEELLADREIDAIYIALPHKFHKEWSVKSFASGKAVLCEKPAALNMGELEEVLRSAQKHHCFYMEAMKTPFIPLIPVIKEKLDAGIIGTVTTVCSNFCSDSMHRISPDSYLFDPVQGGSLYDLGPYPLSFLLYMCGTDIEAISSSMDMHGQIDQAFHAEIRFENGLTGTAHCSICETKERTAVITGSLGKMYIPMCNRPESYEILYNDGTKEAVRMPIPGHDLLGEIEEVHRCLRTGELESPTYNHSFMKTLMKTIDEIHTQ